MRRLRYALCIAALIAAPTALSAPDVTLSGDATIEGPLAALFLLSGADGFEWEATAASVLVERTTVSYYKQESVGPLGANALYDGSTSARTTVDAYEGATLVGGASDAGGAFLAKAGLGDVTLKATSQGLLAILAETDPSLDQGAPAEVDTRNDGTAPDYTIHERLADAYLNLTATSGEYELVGDLVIRLFGPDYTLTSGGEALAFATGDVPETRTGLATKGRLEVQTLTLQDARLVVRAATPVTILTRDPVVAFSGRLVTSGAAVPELDSLPAVGPGEYAGSATLQLATAEGGLAISAPATIASGGAIVARAPPVVALAVGAVALAAVAALAFALLRRRARRDDMDLALLAMEERRWSDALPHLDRLAAKHPDDAQILMDRAICLEESGRLNDARDAYEAALRAQPHNAEAHYYYARTLARLRNGTAALAHLTRALSLDARLSELARNESAFASFRDHPQYRGLVL